MLLLDGGAVSYLAERSEDAAAAITAFRSRGLWPPTVPAVVLVECLQGHPGRDAQANQLLKGCDIRPVEELIARRAARLRRLAQRGSAVDAVLVAMAEHGGTVLTGDRTDIEALATHAADVEVRVI